MLLISRGKTPVVRIELLQSTFGGAGTYEGLKIERNGDSPCHLSDMVPLALLQYELQFRLIYAVSGEYMLQRDVPFS